VFILGFLFILQEQKSDANSGYADLTMTDPVPKEIIKYRKSRFFKDFSVGCGTLILLGILLFVLVPLLILGFKIALWLAVPIAAIIIIVFLVALFGRFVSEVTKRW